MRLIRLQHPVHLVFRDGMRDALPRERTIAPGLVDLHRLRRLIGSAATVNGRPQRVRGRLGGIVRWRPSRTAGA